MKYRLFDTDGPLTYQRFIGLLQQDDEFVVWYSGRLASSASEAFYWELPPVTRANYAQNAECVLVDAPDLAAIRADPGPFQSHFDAAPDADVLVFPNLGGDATLIVPQPLAPHAAYPHLAAFLRQGPQDQVANLWHRVADTVYQSVTTTPLWLSTAGLGVAWLHVRLDTRPKYYRYAPYTDST